MRGAVILAIVAAGAVLPTSAHAERRARVTIKHDAGWPRQAKTIAVRIDGGAWHRVATGRTSRSIAIAVPAAGRAVAFDVKLPRGGALRRWALVMPGARYRVVGNPCAHWGLDVVGGADAVGPERVQVDTTEVDPALFPLVVSTDLMGEDAGEPRLGDLGVLVDKPGVTAPLELAVSAMCSRSGTPVVIYSRAANRRIFDEEIIGHPGALHTLKLASTGGFTLVVAPP